MQPLLHPQRATLAARPARIRWPKRRVRTIVCRCSTLPLSPEPTFVPGGANARLGSVVGGAIFLMLERKEVAGTRLSRSLEYSRS